MKNKETQQFAKFFIKDMKSKPIKYENHKSNLDVLDLSPVK